MSLNTALNTSKLDLLDLFDVLDLVRKFDSSDSSAVFVLIMMDLALSPIQCQDFCNILLVA